MWTDFMDMHSGGGAKEEPYEHIYIEASKEEAKVIFYNRFGHNPERVTCTCCGEDYWASEEENLEALTEYQRRRSATGYRKKGPLIPLDKYLAQGNVLVIRAADIKSSERTGNVPRQGYVWVD